MRVHCWSCGVTVTYIYVSNSITVCIIITGVTQPIPVCVLLAGVWHKHTVILETTQQNTHAPLIFNTTMNQ